MAEDISTLVLKVTSDGIKEGTDALNNLANASDNVEKKASAIEAAMKKASSTNAETTTSVQKLLEKFEKQVALLGLNVSATNSYNAAQKGATAVEQAAAAASGALVDAHKAGIKAANDLVTATNAKAAADRAAAAATKAHEAELRRLVVANDQAVKEQARMDDALTKTSKGHGSNSASIRESMVLMHELSQGSYKRFGGSLMVLANQMDLIPKLFSMIGATSTAAMVGVAAVVLVFAAVAYAAFHAAGEMTAFNKSLILTGNGAGVTADKIEEMAHRIGESTRNGTSNTRNMLEAMAATGRFSAANMETGAGMMTNYSRLTGESAEATVKYFGHMSDGVVKFAMENNKSTGAFSSGVIKQIFELEKLNDRFGAQDLALKTLNEHYTASKIPMSDYAEGWRIIGQSLQDATHTLGRYMALKLGLTRMTDKEAITDAQGKLDEKIANSSRVNKGFTSKDEQKAITDDIRVWTAFVASLKLKAVQDEEAAGVAAATHKANVEGSQARISAEALLKRIRDGAMKEADAVIAWNAERDKMILDGDKISAEENQKVLDDIHKKYIKTPKERGTDTALADRDTELTELKGSFELIKLAHEEFQRNSHDIANKEGEDKRKEFASREAERIEYVGKLKTHLQAELDIYKSYAGKTPIAKQNNVKDVKAATAHSNKEIALQGNASKDDERGVVDKEIAAQKTLAKAVQQTSDAEVHRLDKQLAAETLRLAGIGKLKSELMAEKQRTEDAGTATLELRQQELLADMMVAQANTKLGNDKAVQLAREFEGITEQIRLRTELAAIMGKEVVAQQGVELIERTTKGLDDALAAGTRFGKGLEDAFGSVGKAIGGMSNAFLQMSKDQDIAKGTFRKASEEDKKSGKAQAELDHDNFSANVKGYGNMAGAAKGFFKEGSTGYKLMAGIEKEMHLIEMANQAEKLFTSLFVSTASATGVVAGQAVETAAVVTAQGVQNTAKIPGVFMSFMSAIGPWGAAAAAIAIAAVLGGMGGGGGSAPDTSADRQAKQGTGSVLGDDKAKSESISKSLDILEKNSGLGLVHSQEMVLSLRSISSGIGNLAASLVSGGVISSKTPGVTENQQSAIGSFFGGSSTSITDKGLSINGGSLGGILQNGTTASTYADIHEHHTWRGDDDYRQSTGMTSADNDKISSIITGLSDTVLVAAKKLGVSGEAFADRMSSFNVVINDISGKGLSGTDFQKQIEAEFSRLGDDMANWGITGLKSFQKNGEGALETLSRIANNFEQTSDVMSVLGKSFNATGMDAVKLSENLLDAAGGIDKLTSGTKDFVSGYLTKAEQMAPITKSVVVEMARLNVSAVKTTDQFKALVLSQDMNTKAGQDMYVALLNVAPAFLEAANYATDLANGTVALTTAEQAAKDIVDKQHELDIALMDAQGDSVGTLAAQRKDELAALKKLSPSLLSTQQAIYDVTDATAAANQMRTLEIALLDAQGQATKTNAMKQADAIALLMKTSPAAANLQKEIDIYNNAKASITAAYTAEKTATTTSITRLGALAVALRSFNDSLVLGNLSTLTPQEKYEESRRQFDSILAAAKGTGPDAEKAQAGLQNAETAFLTASQVVNASSDAYQADFKRVQVTTEEMATWAVKQVDIGTASLAALDKQVAGLITVNESVLSVTDAIDALNVTLGGSGFALHPVVSTLPAPTVNNTQATQVDAVAPLLAQIKELTDVVSALRADAQEQTAAIISTNYDANNAAASTVAGSNKDAAITIAYSNRTGVTIV